MKNFLKVETKYNERLADAQETQGNNTFLNLHLTDIN